MYAQVILMYVQVICNLHQKSSLCASSFFKILYLYLFIVFLFSVIRYVIPFITIFYITMLLSITICILYIYYACASLLEGSRNLQLLRR